MLCDSICRFSAALLGNFLPHVPHVFASISCLSLCCFIAALFVNDSKQRGQVSLLASLGFAVAVVVGVIVAAVVVVVAVEEEDDASSPSLFISSFTTLFSLTTSSSPSTRVS